MKRETTASVQEKIKVNIIPLTMIVMGGLFFVFAAALIVEQLLPDTTISITPLPAGSYVPAQVVFKVKSGANADAVLTTALQTPQTLYKSTSTGKFVASYDASYKANPAGYTKTTVQLTKKQLTRIFPDPKIAPAVQAKIMRRSGVKDPIQTFKDLGMDRWYTAQVNQAEADVATLVATLKSDTSGVESAGPNGLAKLDSITAEPPSSTLPSSGPSGQATTATCTNPNDPYSCASGDLYTSSLTDQWFLDAVNVRQAWSTTKGQSSTILAIIDNGFDTQHVDLRNKIWINPAEDINHNGCADYWSSTDYTGHISTCTGLMDHGGGDLNGIDEPSVGQVFGNGYVDDVNGMDFAYSPLSFPQQNNPQTGVANPYFGHGTLVAGIAGAATNSTNPEGVAGVCWNCMIMPLKVYDTTGNGINYSPTYSGQDSFGTAIGRAIKYAADNGADAINMSLAFSNDLTFIQDAIRYAYQSGVVTVIASGNGNANFDNLPIESDPDAIVVGSTDPIGQRSSFSSWGRNLMIVAPGDQIAGLIAHFQGASLCEVGDCSIIPYREPGEGTITDNPSNNSGYQYGSGTSFATPIVTGVVGLLRSVNPALSISEMSDVLKVSAHDIDPVLNENGQLVSAPGPDTYSGYGLVDADAAVREAQNRQPDFSVTPGISPAVAVANNQIRLDVNIDNHSNTTANNVLYRLINADTNTTVYEDRLYKVWAGTGAWLNTTVTLTTAVPAHLKVSVDPTNEFPESFENNNISQIFSVATYGTPVIAHVDSQAVQSGHTTSFTVTATDVNDDPSTLVYSASNMPTGATFNQQVFSWTPDASATGTYSPVFTATDPHNLSSSITVPIVVQGSIPTGYQYHADTCNYQIPYAVPAGQTIWQRVCQPSSGQAPFTYSASGLPPNGNLNNNVFVWTPSSTNVGQHFNSTFHVVDSTKIDHPTDQQFTVAAADTRPNLDYPLSNNPYDYFAWRQGGTDITRIHVRIKNIGGSAAPASTFQLSCYDNGRDPVNSGSLPALVVNQEYVLDQPMYAPCGGVGKVYFVVNYNFAQFSEYPWGSTLIPNVMPLPFSAPTLVFDPMTNKSGNRGDTIRFTVHAHDTIDLPINYSTGTLPPRATFDAATQSFTWPTTTLDSNASVTFYASNGVVQVAQTVTIALGQGEPHLSDPAFTFDNDTATVSWTTDLDANSYVYWGPTTDYGSSMSVKSFVKNHAVTFYPLSPGTTYHFAIGSCTSTKQCTTAADARFMTPSTALAAPSLSSMSVSTGANGQTGPINTLLPVSTIQSLYATVNWNTNYYSCATINYGTTPGSLNSQAQESTGGCTATKFAGNHSKMLAPLLPGTTYYYQIIPVGAGLPPMAQASFQTAGGSGGSAPPTAGTITVTIAWTTNVYADGIINYGPTTAYGTTKNDTAFAKSHTISFPVTNGTTYHYAIRGCTPSGLCTTSVDKDFTLPSPSLSMPTVTYENDTAIVTWNTDVDADGLVNFGTTTAYGINNSNATFAKTHAVYIFPINPSTTYHSMIRSCTAQGLCANSLDGTFTSPATVAVAPTITNINYTVVNRRAIVTWATNYYADGIVNYGPTTAYGQFRNDITMTKNHSILTAQLATGTYHYAVRSCTPTGKCTTSVDKTFVIPL